MTSGIRLTYDYIYDYILENDCILITSNQNIHAKTKIEIRCKCGNTFVTTFDNFANKNKRSCNKCAVVARGEHKRLPIEEVIRRINLAKYNYISGEYICGNNRSLILSDDDGFFYSCSLAEVDCAISNNGRLERFSKTNSFTIENISKWLELNEKHFILVSDRYTYAIDNNLCFKCLDCGEEWIARWANISMGQGCPYCTGRKVGKSNSFGYLYPDILDEWDYDKNDVDPYSITLYTHKKVWWKCNECGREWATRPSKRIFYETGCPYCNKPSRGERKIKLFLDEHGIDYVEQMIFDDCRYSKYPLKFDFYIPNKNIIIEYQGQQHFFPVDFCGKGNEFAENQFEQITERDRFKREYCKNKDICLLEINYYEYDEIDNLLSISML